MLPLENMIRVAYYHLQKYRTFLAWTSDHSFHSFHPLIVLFIQKRAIARSSRAKKKKKKKDTSAICRPFRDRSDRGPYFLNISHRRQPPPDLRLPFYATYGLKFAQSRDRLRK